MTSKNKSTTSPYGDYQWPDNLYDEMYDMCGVAFMIYEFGYVIEAARKNEDFKGITVDSESGQISKSDIPDADRALKRSYTPAEVKTLVQNNIGILKQYGRVFRGNEKTEKFYRELDELEARAQASSIDRPITIEEYDDRYQKNELVYGICKDSINKRITVVFRGTNDLGLASNWMHNFSVLKTEATIPACLKEKLDGKKMDLHSGFHNYLFDETKDKSDAAGTTKFDQLNVDLKHLLAKYPDHKVYVTGHSLGAALSTIASFYLSCDPDIPKPVSNISFAAPRVGDKTFLKAVQHQEKAAQLRIIRSANENDSVTVVPSVGYHHVGISVTTFKTWFWKVWKPEIDYPNPNDGIFADFSRSWNNSMVTSLNLGYDHTEYLERIMEAKHYLEKESVNALYANKKFIGFEVSSL